MIAKFLKSDDTRDIPAGEILSMAVARAGELALPIMSWCGLTVAVLPSSRGSIVSGRNARRISDEVHQAASQWRSLGKRLGIPASTLSASTAAFHAG